MRLDKFLKVSRIIKRRPIANEVCSEGRVSVNGRVAKASTDVAPGDTVAIRFASGTTTIRVRDVKEHVRKDDATSLYEILPQAETDDAPET